MGTMSTKKSYKLQKLELKVWEHGIDYGICILMLNKIRHLLISIFFLFTLFQN